MKIAVASDDQITIARHFGRTGGFLIAELENDQIISRTYRPNNFTHHQVHHPEHGDRQEHSQPHSHDAILENLADCSYVISRGMGRRLYDDLRQAGITALIVDDETVDNALAAFIAGKIIDKPEKSCQH